MRLQNIVIAMLMLLWFCPLSAQPQANPQMQQGVLENKLKALYLLRLAAFVSWPQDSSQNQSDTFNICIDADEPIQLLLKQIKTTQLKGKSLNIVSLSSEQRHSLCHLRYISTNSQYSFDIKSAVLTISSRLGFARDGGMIEFYIAKNKLRMRANLTVIEKAGLTVDPELIPLLKIIKNKGDMR